MARVYPPWACKRVTGSPRPQRLSIVSRGTNSTTVSLALEKWLARRRRTEMYRLGAFRRSRPDALSCLFPVWFAEPIEIIVSTRFRGVQP